MKMVVVMFVGIIEMNNVPEFIKELVVGKVYELKINNQWSYPYISGEERRLKNAERLKLNASWESIKGIFLGFREESYSDCFRDCWYWTKWFADGIFFWTAIDPLRYNLKITLIESDNNKL